MKVLVVGAGPAGLYFARLLKRANPGYAVTVVEQGSRGASWGFGVGLGGRAMREIETLDPAIHRAILAAMDFGDRQLFRVDGQEFVVDYPEAMGAIERLTLLRILAAAAEDVGVVLRYDHRENDLDRVVEDHDLVVASDGINSSSRAQRQAQFGTQSYELTNRFAWYGVAAALRPMALVFRMVGSGAFIGHYYAYGPEASTFVAECDAAAWNGTGMDRMSDAERKALFEQVFAAELEGNLLIENRTVWRRFPVVTNQHLSFGNVVLLGDSLRSAHFSIGSGTRLAMEDAAALFAAFAEARRDVPRALARFETLRRPARDLFGEAARHSFEWYETVATRMDRPILDFIHEFMGRTGRIDDRRLATYAPQFFEEYQRSHARAA